MIIHLNIPKRSPEKIDYIEKKLKVLLFDLHVRNYCVFGKNVVAKISQANHVWDSCVAITITNCNNLFRVKKSD